MRERGRRVREMRKEEVDIVVLFFDFESLQLNYSRVKITKWHHGIGKGSDEDSTRDAWVVTCVSRRLHWKIPALAYGIGLPKPLKPASSVAPKSFLYVIRDTSFVFIVTAFEVHGHQNSCRVQWNGPLLKLLLRLWGNGPILYACMYYVLCEYLYIPNKIISYLCKWIAICLEVKCDLVSIFWFWFSKSILVFLWKHAIPVWMWQIVFGWISLHE